MLQRKYKILMVKAGSMGGVISHYSLLLCVFENFHNQRLNIQTNEENTNPKIRLLYLNANANYEFRQNFFKQSSIRHGKKEYLYLLIQN